MSQYNFTLEFIMLQLAGLAAADATPLRGHVMHLICGITVVWDSRGGGSRGRPAPAPRAPLRAGAGALRQGAAPARQRVRCATCELRATYSNILTTQLNHQPIFSLHARRESKTEFCTCKYKTEKESLYLSLNSFLRRDPRPSYLRIIIPML